MLETASSALAECQVLLDTLDRNTDIFRDQQWKTTTGVMLAIGWLLTSTEARRYFNQHRMVRNSAIGLVQVMFAISALTYVEAGTLQSLLQSRTCFEPDLVAIKVFNFTNYVFTIVFYCFLFQFLGYLIWRTRPDRADEFSQT